MTSTGGTSPRSPRDAVPAVDAPLDGPLSPEGTAALSPRTEGGGGEPEREIAVASLSDWKPAMAELFTSPVKEDVVIDASMTIPSVNPSTNSVTRPASEDGKASRPPLVKKPLSTIRTQSERHLTKTGGGSTLVRSSSMRLPATNKRGITTNADATSAPRDLPKVASAHQMPKIAETEDAPEASKPILKAVDPLSPKVNESRQRGLEERVERLTAENAELTEEVARERGRASRLATEIESLRQQLNVARYAATQHRIASQKEMAEAEALARTVTPELTAKATAGAQS